MSNELTQFEQNNIEVFQMVKSLTERKKEIEKQEKDMKQQLQNLMEEHGVKKIDNEYVTVTYIDESETISIDWNTVKSDEPETYEDLIKDFPLTSIDYQRFENEEPSTYKELLDDYPKSSKRKAHIRLKVK